MKILLRINWPYTLACLAVATAIASFTHEYLDLDYLSAGITGAFGWLGLVIATMVETDERQGKA
jgi:hypothetical protein